MRDTDFPVTGMTCDNCVAAVTGELRSLTGVRAVHVDLVPGGTSTVTVTADRPVGADEVAKALDEAGDYRLVAS